LDLPQDEIITAIPGRWAVGEKLQSRFLIHFFMRELKQMPGTPSGRKNLCIGSDCPFSRDPGLSVRGKV
jgi:hypothetical protein